MGRLSYYIGVNNLAKARGLRSGLDDFAQKNCCVMLTEVEMLKLPWQTVEEEVRRPREVGLQHWVGYVRIGTTS